MKMGPGVACTGDVIWDQSTYRKGDQEKLYVDLGMTLTRSAIPPSEEAKRHNENLEKIRDGILDKEPELTDE